MTRRTLLAATATGLGLAGCTAEPPRLPVVAAQRGDFVLTGVDRVRRVAQLTGPGAMNDTASVFVAGTDLGSMFSEGERTWFLFGDTFGERAADAVGGVGEIWRSNCLAWSTDQNPDNGVSFDGWIRDELDMAKEIIPGQHHVNDGSAEVTKIPTQGFAVDGRLYVGYMSVTHWGDPGQWTADHAGLARSSDHGQNWEILPEVRWPGDSGFVQLAHAHVIEHHVEYLYLWGIGAGRFGPVRLMRVRALDSAISDPAGYEYFAGLNRDDPIWSSDPASATPVLEGTWGEFSVLWSHRLDRWLLTSTTDGNAVVLEGLNPWGPWGEPITLLTQADVPGLYSPYTEPRYTSTDGRTIYFTLSIWGPYNVFWYAFDLVTEAG